MVDDNSIGEVVQAAADMGKVPGRVGVAGEGTTICCERIGSKSAGKKGEIMIGCVSEVLTTCPKTAAGPFAWA